MKQFVKIPLPTLIDELTGASVVAPGGMISSIASVMNPASLENQLRHVIREYIPTDRCTVRMYCFFCGGPDHESTRLDRHGFQIVYLDGRSNKTSITTHRSRKYLGRVQINLDHRGAIDAILETKIQICENSTGNICSAGDVIRGGRRRDRDSHLKTIAHTINSASSNGTTSKFNMIRWGYVAADDHP